MLKFLEITTKNKPAALTPESAALFAAQFAGNTMRAYKSDLKAFADFCNTKGVSSFPTSPQTLADYLSALHLAGKKVATIERAAAAISKLHKLGNHATPLTGEALGVMAGIKRLQGVAPKQAKALRGTEITNALLNYDTSTLRGLRDKTALLLTFAGCFRRGEVAELKVSDICFTERGAEVLLKRSKTDQTGEGIVKVIPFAQNTKMCAATYLKEWLKKSGVTTYVFCSITKGDKLHHAQKIAGDTIYRLVKSVFGSDYSGHSLRVGFAVTAKEGGAAIDDIETAGGWKSSAMPKRYTKQVDAWARAASYKLGL